MKNCTKHFWREKARAPVNVCPFRNRLFCIRSDIHCEFPQVNVTFAYIKFSLVNGMFALAGLYRQAKWNILKQILENEEFYMKVLDSEKKERVRRYTCGDA